MLTELIKTTVKVGLKTAAPIIGTLGAELASTAASEFIDREAKARTENIQKRLFDRIKEDLSQALGPSFRDGDIPAPITAAVESILQSYEFDLQLWATSGFDKGKAAKEALEHGRPFLIGLNADETSLCEILVKSFFSALAQERSAIEKTESDFRRQVLDGVSHLRGAMEQMSEDVRRELESLVSVAALRIPVQTWSQDLSPPGALLRADIDDPVPFHGRDDEIASLLTWCGGSASIGACVITGPGGIGKTRYMIEMCRRLQQQGWKTGFLDSRLSGDHPRYWSAILGGPKAIFVVVDYAETRRDQVVELIGQLLSADREKKARLVLLARAADDWWDELRRQPRGVGDLLSGPASQSIRLLPLTIGADDRRESFEKAAAHFARKLGSSIDQAIPDDLVEPHYEQTLILHMTALAAVEGVAVKGDQGILDYVLQRERRFWAEHAERRDLPSYLEAAVGQFMAAVTLAGGAEDESAGLDLASRIPLLADQPAAIRRSAAELLHDIYPGDHWIEPVLPDLLGEHLCQVELEGAADTLLELVLGPEEPSSP